MSRPKRVGSLWQLTLQLKPDAHSPLPTDPLSRPARAPAACISLWGQTLGARLHTLSRGPREGEVNPGILAASGASLCLSPLAMDKGEPMWQQAELAVASFPWKAGRL